MADRPIVYEPPDSSLIDQVVRRTCREIGEAEYSHTDVRDFANFMKHLSSAVAHGMNESSVGELDNGIE